MTDHKHTDRDGGERTLYVMRREWEAVSEAWREHTDQDGWTHVYAQRCRRLVEHGPITSAMLIAIVIPILAIALGVALLV